MRAQPGTRRFGAFVDVYKRQLLHQLNTWLLCFWIPLISTATLVIGLVAGMGIRGCMDSVPEAAAKPAPIVVQAVPTPEPHENGGPVDRPKQQRHNQSK